MIHFRVFGPCEIEPFHGCGRMIEETAIQRFWERYPERADEVGCYIFGFRAGHGLVPVYVGQATTGFKHECFQHHKLNHYNKALVHRMKGTPIMFFIARESGPTATLPSCLNHLEDLLIHIALSRNPRLENVKRLEWNVQGVFHSSPGHVSASAMELRRLLGMFPKHAEDTAENEETLVVEDGVPSAANISRAALPDDRPVVEIDDDETADSGPPT